MVGGRRFGLVRIATWECWAVGGGGIVAVSPCTIKHLVCSFDGENKTAKATMLQENYFDCFDIHFTREFNHSTRELNRYLHAHAH